MLACITHAAPSSLHHQTVACRPTGLHDFGVKLKAHFSGGLPSVDDAKAAPVLQPSVVVVALSVLVGGGDCAVEAVLAPGAAPAVADNPVEVGKHVG